MSKNRNMETFITEAIENKAEEESRLVFNEEEMFGTPRITIVGCGGAGWTAVGSRYWFTARTFVAPGVYRCFDLSFDLVDCSVLDRL